MSEVDALADLLAGRRVMVLTGAGISTESGIPDYRGPGTARRARKPIQFRQFTSDPAWRARYWARSAVGWTRMADTRPNPAHRALVSWEGQGGLTGVVSQNVDGLHRKAGTTALVDLHGRLSEVVCLACGWVGPRADWQQRLRDANPDFEPGLVRLAPDGDADLTDGGWDFTVPPCPRCGGVVKPHVVFFGENVPRARVQQARAWLDDADALLVVGSSLTVFSGYRFVKYAAAQGKPVGIVDLGSTRGDALATVKAVGKAGRILPALVDALT